MNLKTGILTILIAAGSLGMQSKVTLPSYFSDNMIVQQESILKMKGKATPSTQVKITAGWEGSPRTVKSGKDGSFSIDIPTPKAGGPYYIMVEDNDGAQKFENVIAGEVWLCSGQSNMEMPTEGWTTVMDYDHEIATAHHPDIRLLQVRKNTDFRPREDVELNGDGWQICTSASMADFSAIGYYFARELNEKLGVPVGVIDTTWGGTPAEAWTSQSALEALGGFESELNNMKKANYDRQTLNGMYQQQIADWLGVAKTGSANFDKGIMQSGGDWRKISAPGYWEVNGLPGLDGLVWLQREIILPEDASDRPLTLKFAAIDDEDETYFNGTLVGKGSGYNVPREYQVPQHLVRPGSNVITIKVMDFGGEGGIAPGVASALTGGSVIPLDGEWNCRVEKDFSALPPKPSDPNSSSYPSVLYNAMLEPLRDMPVKGVLWYQGCANVGRDEQYGPLFKALIKDWRSLWGDDMPFYFVQLAGYLAPVAVQPDSDWAKLRQAQASALELPNTAMATAIDLGNPADIHPKNKQEVAHRLALIALGRDYGGTEPFSGPTVTDYEYDNDAVILTFNEEIKPTSTAITGFIIADKSGEFTTATPVKIDANTLKISASGIKSPTALKYNWADYPGGNLYGASGLPVAPFSITLQR